MSLVMVAKEETTRHPVVNSGSSGEVAFDYFGGLSGRETGSEAFGTDERNGIPGALCAPVDQFQLVFGARDANHDRHGVVPQVLNYIDAFTPSASFNGENHPFWLYTCRARAAPPVSLVSTDSDLPTYRGGRNIVVNVFEVRSIHAYGDPGVHISYLIPEEEDGLRADRIVADSGAGIDLPDTFGTSGQFVFVSGGSIWHQGREYAFASFGWMSADEAGQDIAAGADGTECLIMRFPYPPNRPVRLAS